MAGAKGRSGGPRNGAGRKPGIPNKVSKDLKEAIMGAFGAVGGAKYLQQVAKDDPKAFCTLLGKVLPMTVAGDKDNPIVTEVKLKIVGS